MNSWELEVVNSFTNHLAEVTSTMMSAIWIHESWKLWIINIMDCASWNLIRHLLGSYPKRKTFFNFQRLYIWKLVAGRLLYFSDGLRICRSYGLYAYLSFREGILKCTIKINMHSLKIDSVFHPMIILSLEVLTVHIFSLTPGPLQPIAKRWVRLYFFPITYN